MNIEDMRIGGQYMLAGELVECVGLTREMHGGRAPTAAFRDQHDNFIWHHCSEYRRVTRADLAAVVRRDYANPNPVKVPRG